VISILLDPCIIEDIFPGSHSQFFLCAFSETGGIKGLKLAVRALMCLLFYSIAGLSERCWRLQG
jgi:hypothetical protein